MVYDVASRGFTSRSFVTRGFRSCGVTVMSRGVMSHYTNLVLCHVICHVMSRVVVPCHVVCCLVTKTDVLSRDVTCSNIAGLLKQVP